MIGRRAVLLGSVLLVAGVRRAAADQKYAVTHTDAQWRKILTPAQSAAAGDRAAVFQPVVERTSPRGFQLRGLRTAAVFIGDEVRQRDRLAEFLAAAAACGADRGG